jgi:hypothetical protein
MQDYFTYYICQQTILADVTVGCQSNGRRASSISDLLALAAKSSAGGTACSRLPWPAVLPRRPHRPLLLPPLARPSLYSPTSLHCCGFATSGSFPSWHGVVNIVNKRQHRKRDVHGEADSWDPHGPWPHASKYLFITPKRMNPPNDSWDPPAISWHGRKCLLIK